MRWASALSRHQDASAALDQAIDAVRAELDGAPAHLVLVFFSPHFLLEASRIAGRLRAAFPEARVAGSTATGVAGRGEEAEDAPALSLVAAHLPGVRLEAFHALETERPKLKSGTRAAVVLADVFSWDAGTLLSSLDESCPTAVKVGGCASGGEGPGEHALILDGTVRREGAVVVGLSGAVAVQVLVAQGCQPIGPRYRVTRAEHNLVYEIDGVPTLEVLVGLHKKASPEQRERLKESLAMGLGVEVKSLRGELLAHTIVGLEPTCGAVAVGALPEPGQEMQFLLRDAQAAVHDLEARLAEARSVSTPPSGALLFSCLARGQHLFGVEGHDSSLFSASFPGVPVGGSFCAGEIAPLAGRTRVHGFTSVFALFRPAPDAMA